MAIRYDVDSGANDSLKTFTVPDGHSWRPHIVTVDFTATATAGDRQVTLDFYDATPTLICSVKAADVLSATESGIFVFGIGCPRETAFVDSVMQSPLPLLVLLPGYSIKVWDSADVDAAADDMIVVVGYNERVVE